MLRITQLIDLVKADKYQQLHSKIDRLNSVNPLATLSRGYSITRSENNKIITNASQIEPGARISNQLHDGTVHSIVESIDSH